MGIYIFNRQTLIDSLRGPEDDFGRDIIPKLIKDSRVFAYSFVDNEKGTPNYWRDVGTIISESILFKGVIIGKGAQVRKAIIEQNVKVPAGTRIGFNIVEDRKRFTVSTQGVVVVGAKAIF